MQVAVFELISANSEIINKLLGVWFFFLQFLGDAETHYLADIVFVNSTDINSAYARTPQNDSFPGNLQEFSASGL